MHDSMNNHRGFARKRIESKAEYYYIPDEIIVNILSRLPAKDVLHCRCVCRRFKDLTSNQSFQDLHLKHCLPMILAVDKRIKRREDTFLLDKWWETGRTRSVIHRFSSQYRHLFSNMGVVASSNEKRFFDSEFCILFSLNGLVVLEEMLSLCEDDKYYFSGKFIILNPMNGENVRISLSREICWSDLYGVYFHPVLNEYCSFWRVSPKDQHVEYKVLNLGSKQPRWEKIKNPSDNKNPRIRFIAPVFIDKFLYWVVEAGEDSKYSNRSWNTIVTLQLDIMEFDIITQELKMMSSPVPGLLKHFNFNVHLVNMEGCLSVVQILRVNKLVVDINIWTLKDRVQRSWECSDHRINLDLYPRKYHLRVGVLQAVCTTNGELAIQIDRTLFVYNLKKGTIRILGKKKHSHDLLFLSHLMTFASLRNCKSSIWMDECGEVDKKDRSALKSSMCKESNNEKESSSLIWGRKGINEDAVIP